MKTIFFRQISGTTFSIKNILRNAKKLYLATIKNNVVNAWMVGNE